jgi:hypothetical protein
MPITLAVELALALLAGIQRAQAAGRDQLEADEVAAFTDRLARESVARADWQAGRQGDAPAIGDSAANEAKAREQAGA